MLKIQDISPDNRKISHIVTHFKGDIGINFTRKLIKKKSP